MCGTEGTASSDCKLSVFYDVTSSVDPVTTPAYAVDTHGVIVISYVPGKVVVSVVVPGGVLGVPVVPGVEVAAVVVPGGVPGVPAVPGVEVAAVVVLGGLQVVPVDV